MAKQKSPPITVTVAEFMIPIEKLHVITPPMNLGEVAELLVRYNISGAPVVDSSGKLLTLIGEGILLRMAARYGLSTLVVDLMTELPKEDALVTVHREATFLEVYRIFLTNNVHRIPVMDSNGLVLGMVTRSSIFRMFVEAHHGRKLPPR
jgi:CBS domain-containing protein